MHAQRVAVLVCAGLGALGTFLPWATVPLLGTISGTAGDGWFTLALFLPAIVLSLAGDRSGPLVGGRRVGAVIPGALASAMAIWKIVDLRAAMQAPDDNPFAAALNASVTIGAGLYLIAIMGVALAITAFAMSNDSA